jgi:hypothetical protein
MGAGPGRFEFNPSGTRFRVFAHSARLGFVDEVVRIDARPGSIGPGPRDDALDVIDALDKPSYCSDATGRVKKRPRPPYPPDGPRTTRPARPVGGHFAHIRPGRRAFSAAMAFAVVRLTLEVWRHFLQRPVRWHFADTVGPVLQVHPRVGTSNAWSGDGYLEFGYPDWDWTTTDPFAENLEVIAHETGHLIMKSVIGTLPDDARSVQHRAHEEAAADLVALVLALHFESVIAHVLRQTHGYLYADCVLSRIGEWGTGGDDVARHAFNEATLASVRAAPERLNKHVLSAPFTGAVYDVLVEIFVDHLVAAGAISRALADACHHEPGRPVADLSAPFARVARGRRPAFAEALRQARDDVAGLLAGAWRRSTTDGLVYGKVLTHMLAADAELGLGRARLLRDTFALRGITPVPAAARPS